MGYPTALSELFDLGGVKGMVTQILNTCTYPCSVAEWLERRPE